MSLIAAPLCGLAWSLLVPPFTGGMAGEVAFIAAHPGRWAAATHAGVLFSYLMIPAILGVVHLVQGRAAVLGLVGGALALTGAAYHGTVLGFQLAETAVVARAGDRAQALALATALFEQPAFVASLAPVTGLFLGLLLLAAALWRARATSRWVVGLLAAAVVVELVGPPAFKARLFFALLLGALGWVGAAVLRMSDAAWRRAGAPGPAEGPAGPTDAPAPGPVTG